MLLLFPGMEYASLHQLAKHRQTQARAPGTLSSHRTGISTYLAFCARLNIQPYQVSYDDICVYIEYLAKHIPAPATIRNKISQVRTHFSLMDVPLTHINHIRVSRALDALDRNKFYIPRIKEPLEPMSFYHILSSLGTDPNGIMIRAALLTLYYGCLRQSELMPRTVTRWDPLVQPTRGDMYMSDSKCFIHVKKAKNMQKYGQYKTVVMQSAQDYNICPVTAISHMVSLTPTLSSSDPLFMFYDTRDPVPSSFVLTRLHETMKLTGLQQYIPITSLHSIRKSAATDAFMAGCSENSIKNYGAWSSSAYKAYIKTSNHQVNQSLIRTLDQSSN